MSQVSLAGFGGLLTVAGPGTLGMVAGALSVAMGVEWGGAQRRGAARICSAASSSPGDDVENP